MLGRPRRNTSVLDLLVFILVAAIGIMEVAIIATPITAVIIIKVIILIGMGITITAAVMRIMVADRDITAAARCQPFRIDLIPATRRPRWSGPSGRYLSAVYPAAFALA